MTEKLSFDEHLKNIFGDELDKFLNHPPVGDYIRINTLRTTTDEVAQILEQRGFEVERIAGVDDALRLKSMPYEPTLCLHHFAGWFVKQSLSSQLPVRYLDARPGQTIIDLCAAPGSKTSQIATAMHNQGCLYANDLAGKRMTPLAARLDAMQVTHSVLYNMAAERLPHILPPIFDRVLADVPCTGLGHNDTLNENRWRYETAKNPSSWPDAVCSRSAGESSTRRVRSIPKRMNPLFISSSLAIPSNSWIFRIFRPFGSGRV